MYHGNLQHQKNLQIGCLVAASTAEKGRGGLLETKFTFKLHFPAADFWREICLLKLCHHGWLTSSYSRIPLEHIMGNKFYSPSCMMFWGIHWGGRWICDAWVPGFDVAASLMRDWCFLTSRFHTVMWLCEKRIKILALPMWRKIWKDVFIKGTLWQ